MESKGVIDLLGGGALGYFVVLLIFLHLAAFGFWIVKVMCTNTDAVDERKNK